MAETLGSLCDKLTIIKLKQYHNENNAVRALSLSEQETDLIQEMQRYILSAIDGKIPQRELVFASNKIHNQPIDELPLTTIGNNFARLAEINTKLWHEQEKVYNPSDVNNPKEVFGKPARLNLERNQAIESIDLQFREMIWR